MHIQVLATQLEPSDIVPLTVSSSHTNSNSSHNDSRNHSHPSPGNRSAGGTALAVIDLAGDEHIPVFVGDTLRLRATVSDANPTDSVKLYLHLQGEFQSHPSGLLVQAVEGGGANRYELTATWAPVVRDSGKVTQVCVVAEGQRLNPSRTGAVYASDPIRRCITVSVPSCEVRVCAVCLEPVSLCTPWLRFVYRLLALLWVSACAPCQHTLNALAQVRVKPGDTLRSVAKAYNIPWRTLFLINPDLSQAGDGLMRQGQVLRIGRKFRLYSSSTAYQYSIENASETFSVTYANLYNHNAAAVLRLSAAGALTCSANDPPDTCKVRGQVDPARHVVSDVRFSSLDQTQQYQDTTICLVARFHANCI